MFARSHAHIESPTCSRGSMPIASLSACCELATSNDERSLPSWLFSSSGLATRRKRVSKETLGMSSWIEIALRRS